VILCRRLDLFGRELLAVDGTRIKAVNNKDRNFTTGSLQKFIEAADKKLEDYLKRLDAGDAEERATGGSRVENLTEKIEALRKKRSEYAAHRSALEKNGESQVSLTDPDSRAMAAHTKVGVGYNIQVAVDAKHKMIVEQEVTNQVLDMGLLKDTAEPAREILEVGKIDVVADKGYFRTEDIAACEEAGLTPYLPRPQRGAAVKNGFFRKDEFRYDAKQNVYICPAGQALTPRRQTARIEKSRLRQSPSLPNLRAALALHEGCSRRLPPRKRGRARSNGRATEGETGDSLPASRDRRASLRHDQAMDEPGGLPHAWPPKSARRVQPDGACLQSAPGAQRPWRGKADGGRGGVKRTSNRARPRAKTSSARSWRLRRSKSGFWRKMTKYSMNLHQIYRRSSIRRRFHIVCFKSATSPACFPFSFPAGRNAKENSAGARPQLRR